MVNAHDQTPDPDFQARPMPGKLKGASRSKRSRAARTYPVAASAPPRPKQAKRPRPANNQAERTAVVTGAPPAGKRRRGGKLRRPGAVRRIAGVVRRHPVASVVGVLATGALATWLVRSRGRWVPALAAIPRAIPPVRLPDIRPLLGQLTPLLGQLTPQLRPLSRRIGVAGLQMSTDLADGARRKFGVRWKRRPADASEHSWPTDEVELGSTRADGGRTGVELMWKTLPADALPDSGPRYPGDSPLGETSMQLETKRRDGRTTGMAFTWRKLPVRGRPPDGTPEQGP